ncbi:LysR substrate-binding domain-containing protein [Aestuariispira insulae]|uniref:LysR family transcriptional regulator n=1 Tax=Aestuariispira insulae TaxID=1461337 RepID=A0A3D9HVG5_9PROT|nr:LysR substrate-binding domain-containing protein [Aestuariispira insulae]RED53430.1 LysR family transcriptional regulator [Aestuariispira insulae]
MRKNSPPMTAIRAFEAAARRESFARAAEELNVTSGAISQQISQLESRLGIRLFRRVKQRMYLTEAGRTYLPPLRDALDRVEAATVDLLTHGGQIENLKVASLPTLATRWLVPRLVPFNQEHPEIRISLSAVDLNFATAERAPDLAGGQIDLCLFYGDGHWPGLKSIPLMDEELITVASPSLVLRHLNTPREVTQYPMLHHSTRPESWLEWCAIAEVETDLTIGHSFEHFFMLIEAAVSGLGVALLPRVLVERELAFGQLIQVSDITVKSRRGYFLIYPPDREANMKVLLFRDWLCRNTGRQLK